MIKKLSTILLVLIFIYSGCATGRSNDIRSNMREVYGTTKALYNYVWSPELFGDPRSRTEILGLISQLRADFHHIEGLGPYYTREPGFALTIDHVRRELKDIHNRFREGKTDYANWRLRALTHNCTACHSRYEAPGLVFGDTPPPIRTTFESRLAAAEFLIASRNFETASEELFKFSSSLIKSETTNSAILQALKLWLLVEVRIRNAPASTTQRLAQLAELAKKDAALYQLIKAWETDVSNFSEVPSAAREQIAIARSLLDDDSEDRTIQHSELVLAKTLRATSILHRHLDSAPAEKDRREALFLLGVSYDRLPIAALDTFRELYLEHCIREYPSSLEAQKAYDLFYQRTIEIHSGSSGVNLEPEDEKLLAELKALAFGTT